MARCAWNTSANTSLGGLTPYQVVTRLIPRSPLANFLRLPAAEQVTAEDYVKELLTATQETHDLVKKAQARRQQELADGAARGRIKRHLDPGETVLLRRPPTKPGP